MGEVIIGPWSHARTSPAASRLRAAKCAKASSEMSDRPRDLASRTTLHQCAAGIPRSRQPLTVDLDCPRPSEATSVPPKPSITSLQVDAMGPNIVRAVRTSQGFAKCGTTFFPTRDPIEDMEPDSDEAVGKRIVALRERAGLQQQQLAKQIHITKSTLSAYESGTRPLTMESARRLRRRFGVTVDWLLFGDMQVTGRDLMLNIGPEPEAEQPKKVRSLRK